MWHINNNKITPVFHSHGAPLTSSLKQGNMAVLCIDCWSIVTCERISSKYYRSGTLVFRKKRMLTYSSRERFAIYCSWFKMARRSLLMIENSTWNSSLNSLYRTYQQGRYSIAPLTSMANSLMHLLLQWAYVFLISQLFVHVVASVFF